MIWYKKDRSRTTYLVRIICSILRGRWLRYSFLKEVRLISSIMSTRYWGIFTGCFLRNSTRRIWCRISLRLSLALASCCTWSRRYLVGSISRRAMVPSRRPTSKTCSTRTNSPNRSSSQSYWCPASSISKTSLQCHQTHQTAPFSWLTLKISTGQILSNVIKETIT